jgi:hypothetical protein
MRWPTREVSKLSGLILAWQEAVFLVGADEKDAAEGTVRGRLGVGGW